MSAAEEVTELPTAPQVMHALKTAGEGHPVLRIAPMGKEATDTGWPGLATTSSQEIGRLWQTSPFANHGYTLDGLVAVDIDTEEAHGSDGFATWAALTAGRELPPTRQVITSTDGWHLVYKLPDGWAVKSVPGGLGPGLDVKSGACAYLVGPGSRTPNGAYTLACDLPPAPAPGWLLDELRTARLVVRDDATSAVVKPSTYVNPERTWEPLGRFGATIQVGQRHDTLLRFACSMRERRFSRAEAHRLLWHRFTDCEQPTQHPYTWAEAEAVLDDVWQRYPSGSRGLTETASGYIDSGDGPPMVDPVIFHGLLGEAVRAADPHTEADPLGVLVSLLAGIGVVLGYRPHLMVGSTRHPLLIWPLLFGRTGSSRKGDAGETANKFLLTSYPTASGLTVSGLSSGEGLIERIRDTEGADDPGGTEDKRLIVIEPEFASVMARAKREGSTLAAVLRQAWDGRGLSVLNRSALKASSSHVAIIGHVTPREFRRRLAETEMSGGTYNRLLPIYVERSKRLAMPEPIPDTVLSPLTRRLGKAITSASAVDRVTLDPAAMPLWEEFYDELTATDDEDAAWHEFTRRAAPYCLRIAALYAVLNNKTTIAPEHLFAAAALVRYAIDSARYVLNGQSSDPRLDKIRRAVDGSTAGLSRTEISGLFSRNLTGAVLDELLDELLRTGHYSTTEISTGGRPATRYVRSTKEEEGTPTTMPKG